jgi:hypothetical protein
MSMSLKKQLSMLVIAGGFAALEASIATNSVAKHSHVRRHSASAGRMADKGGTWNNPNYGYASAPFRGPRHYYPDPSMETVLWTTGRFRVAATRDNRQTAGLGEGSSIVKNLQLAA